VTFSIAKRLEMADRKTFRTRQPFLIQIGWDEALNQYSVAENMDGNHCRHRRYEDLAEYVFDPEYMGPIHIDLMNHPSGEGNVYCILAAQLRKEMHLSKYEGFALEFTGEHIDPADGRGAGSTRFNVYIHPYRQ